MTSAPPSAASTPNTGQKELKGNTPYLPAIDGLRFLALLLVLVSHWCHEYWRIDEIPVGATGVDIFFVISGFLITGILLHYKETAKTGKALGTFFMRRVLRIFPLYYTVLIVATLGNHGPIRDALWYNLTYTTNFYFLEVGEWSALFSHFWSLAVEEQFYLFWPFVILLIPIKRLPVVLTLIVLGSIAFRAWIYVETGNYMAPKIHTPACLDALALGGLLAWVARYRTAWLYPLHRLRWLSLIPVLGLCALVYYHLESDEGLLYVTLQRTLVAIATTWWIAALYVRHHKGIRTSWLGHKWMAELGKLSYGMYLLHNLIPGLLLGITFPAEAWARFPLYFVATLLGAWILRKLIENPMNRLKKRFTVVPSGQST